MGESTVRPEAGLVDLLDRVLDRGLVLHADIMITLAGIPLVGLTLRAQLAGIETMIADPQMREWDKRIRAQATRRAEAAQAIQAEKAAPAAAIESAASPAAEPGADLGRGEAIVA